MEDPRLAVDHTLDQSRSLPDPGLGPPADTNIQSNAPLFGRDARTRQIEIGRVVHS